MWAPPGSAHPRIEFHDTVEEMFTDVYANPYGPYKVGEPPLLMREGKR